MKIVLRVLGTLSAVGAAIAALVSLDAAVTPAQGGVQPLGALALAAASFALLKASELWS